MKLRIADIIDDSIVDGPGLRLAVFVQGCKHNCPGCHNPQTHDVNGGREVDTSYVLERFFQNPLLDGITFSGGEPFLQSAPLSLIAEKIKEKGFNVIIYTGFVWEELIANKDYMSLLKYADILIDGPFIQELKSYDLDFKGSSNQRTINVAESLLSGKVVLWHNGI